MQASVSYFEIDNQQFVVYCEMCSVSVGTQQPSSSLQSSSSHRDTLTTSTTTKKVIKVTISDGENIFYNHHSLHHMMNSQQQQQSNNNEYNLFQMIHTSMVKQDDTKFKYRITCPNDSCMNFIISMKVNPSGDYIIANIELTKSSNTRSGHISLFRYLIQSKEADERTITKLSKQSKHYNECMEQSKQVIEEKNGMEKELYSQFIVLLNSKKEAIRKYNQQKVHAEELLEKERLKSKQLMEEKKQLMEEIELLKQQGNSSSGKNKSMMTLSSKRKSPSLSNYQTPKKSRNAKSVDAEDLLDGLSFE